ncbi:MAG: 4Fe-4S dicluster domain-containing protein, partial [Moorea sp. SIO3C2]|nr:4Fe-4S dicluster domain-containing protein [Moorena sp. SIO3C2]
MCTRCGACDPICPVDCISFDEQRYPVIDTKTCVDCGLCVKVCPGIDFDYTAQYK